MNYGLGHDRDPELAHIPVGLCTCGHRSYEHGRRKSPGSPQWDVTGCNVDGCPCAQHVNADGTKWPYGIGP